MEHIHTVYVHQILLLYWMFISDIHLVEQSIITRGCLEIYVYFRLLGQSKNEICSLGLLVFFFLR